MKRRRVPAVRTPGGRRKRWGGGRGGPGRWAVRAGEQGSSIVEFALVLPMLLACFLGIFTGGTAYFRKITVVDAVREGARYGASLVVDANAGGTPAWETAVRTRVVQLSGGELAPADVCVKLVLPAGGGDCGVNDPPGADAESGVHVVKVAASTATTMEFLFFDRTLTLSGKMAARYERDTG